MKDKNNNSPKQASTTFHNIMAASVKGNPKPKTQKQIGDINLPIESLELPGRLINALKNGNIITIKDLVSHYGEDLQQMKNIGFKSIVLIENTLNERGLRFGQL